MKGEKFCDLGLVDLPLASQGPIAVYRRRLLFLFKGILAVAALCLCVTVLILAVQVGLPWRSVLNSVLLVFLGMSLGTIWCTQILQSKLERQAEERRRLNEEWITVRTTRRDALAVIRAARRPARRRGPVSGPIAAAAAVFVIAFSAVGLLAQSAQPGDNLWGVTEVLYSDYARSVETAAAVRSELEQSKKALQEGKPKKAKALLDRIRQQLPAIAEAEGKADLTTQHRELERELVADPSAASSTTPAPSPVPK